tara:strand:+ start:728 stop:1126 length:399 start_codon:yes stop_codon:yes gene_type:complete
MADKKLSKSIEKFREKPVKMQQGGTPMDALKRQLSMETGNVLSEADVARIESLMGSRGVPAQVANSLKRFLTQQTGNALSDADISRITRMMSARNPSKPPRMKKGGAAKMKDGGVVRGAGAAISGTTFRGVR